MVVTSRAFLIVEVDGTDTIESVLAVEEDTGEAYFAQTVDYRVMWEMPEVLFFSFV